AAADVRHALAPIGLDRAIGGAGRDVDANRTGRAVDVEVSAERHDVEGHLDFGVQVVALAVERGMGLDVHDDVQIPLRATLHAVFTLAVQAQALPVGDAGGNPDGDAPVLCRSAGAAAGGTRIAHDAPGPSALVARPRNDEEALLEPQLPRPTALGTDIG